MIQRHPLHRRADQGRVAGQLSQQLVQGCVDVKGPGQGQLGPQTRFPGQKVETSTHFGTQTQGLGVELGKDAQHQVVAQQVEERGGGVVVIGRRALLALLALEAQDWLGFDLVVVETEGRRRVVTTRVDHGVVAHVQRGGGHLQGRQLGLVAASVVVEGHGQGRGGLAGDERGLARVGQGRPKGRVNAHPGRGQGGRGG